MTETEIFDGLLAREGGLRDAVKRPDGSVDPLTYRGVTVNTLGLWRQLGRPATRAELLGMTDAETRAIYRVLYIDGPGFTPTLVPYEPLRLQLVDFGVTSGPERAVRWLQRLLRLPVTSRLDPVTVEWLRSHAGYLWLVNEGLAAVRAYMVTASVDDGTIRREDERGLLRRAASLTVTRS